MNDTIQQHQNIRSAIPTLLLLWGIVFITLNVRTFFGPISIAMSQSFGVPSHTILSLSTYIATGNLFALLCSGHISYHLLHTRTLVLALSLMTIGLVVSGLANQLLVLRIAFLVLGLGAGLYPGSGITIANAMSSEKIRSKVIAIHETGPVGAFIFVPIFSASILVVSSWRLIMFIYASMSVGMLVLVLLGCKEGYFRGKRLNFSNTKVVIKNPLFLAIVAAFALTGTANIVLYNAMTEFLVLQRGFSAASVSIILSLSRVSGLLMIFFTSMIMSRMSPVNVVIFTGIGSGILTILLGISQGVILLSFVFLQTFIMSGFFPAIFVSLGKVFAVSYQNLAVTITLIMSQVSGILMPLVASQFSKMNMTNIFFIVIGCSIIVSALIVFFVRKFSTHE